MVPKLEEHVLQVSRSLGIFQRRVYVTHLCLLFYRHTNKPLMFHLPSSANVVKARDLADTDISASVSRTGRISRVCQGEPVAFKCYPLLH